MMTAFAFLASSRPGSGVEDRYRLVPMINSDGVDLEGAACKIARRLNWVGLGRNRESQGRRPPCRKAYLISR